MVSTLSDTLALTNQTLWISSIAVRNRLRSAMKCDSSVLAFSPAHVEGEAGQDVCGPTGDGAFGFEAVALLESPNIPIGFTQL